MAVMVAVVGVLSLAVLFAVPSVALHFLLRNHRRYR